VIASGRTRFMALTSALRRVSEGAPKCRRAAFAKRRFVGFCITYVNETRTLFAEPALP